MIKVGEEPRPWSDGVRACERARQMSPRLWVSLVAEEMPPKP